MYCVEEPDMAKINELILKLRRDEDGAALTEYLILLGLVAGGVAAAVTAFGGELGTQFTAWDTYIGTNATPPSGG